jgi:hypothetical protein
LGLKELGAKMNWLAANQMPPSEDVSTEAQEPASNDRWKHSDLQSFQIRGTVKVTCTYES